MNKYIDRQDAGKKLASHLLNYMNQKDVIVLALPRGGVPIAYEIAKALHAPLDVFIVRKLGVPWHSELAMGAIAPGGVTFFNHGLIQQLGISEDMLQAVIEQELQELNRREIVYRGTTDFPDLKNKTVILVDDGIATGATMQVAILAIKKSQPAKLIVAVPVAAIETCEILKAQVDELICPLQPEDLQAVGLWYQHFSQTEDAEVHQLLEDAKSSLK